MRRYLPYRQSLEGASPDCPVICDINVKRPFDANRSEFCEKCPYRVKKKEFEAAIVPEWWKTFGDATRELDFTSMLTTVHHAQTAEKLPPEELSSAASIFVLAYQQEEARYREMLRAQV